METTTRVLPSNDYTSTNLLNPNQVTRQHVTHPAYIENPTQANKAITWEHNRSHTNTAPSNPTNQTVSPQPSIFDRMADILRPGGVQSIAKAFFAPETDAASVTHSRPSRSVVPMSAILEDIAKAYPAGVNSPQYQFVSATINSSPTLLATIETFPALIRVTDQPATEINSNLSISKSELEQAYQLSQTPGSATLGKAKLLAKLAHEFGRIEYELGNLRLTKTFEDRAKAWVNSLPSATQGLKGFNTQLFADDFVTTELAPEAFAAIQAWNTVIDATKTLDPAQYVSIANSTIKTNRNGTISPTVENVYQRAQIFARDADYKNRYFFDGGGMTLLASHARSGDVIRLSGYDANRIMAYGFIQKAGERDTFIKI